MRRFPLFVCLLLCVFACGNSSDPQSLTVATVVPSETVAPATTVALTTTPVPKSDSEIQLNQVESQLEQEQIINTF